MIIGRIVAIAVGCLLALPAAMAQVPDCEDLEAAETARVSDAQAKCVEKLEKHGCDTSLCGTDAPAPLISPNPACAVHEGTQSDKLAKAEGKCEDALVAAGCDATVCVPQNDGGTGIECTHEPLVEGVALDPACDTVVECTCGADPFCCDMISGSWDSFCVCKYGCTFDSGCASASDCSLLCGF